MFVYYFVTVESGVFEDVERSVVEALGGVQEHADIAYRRGEELRARLYVDGLPLAKTVRMEVGQPLRRESETIIPLTWEATGARRLFPRMEADLVVSALGPGVTHIGLRGRYEPPMGPVGRALDRALLHRVAEISVKEFLDRLAAAVTAGIESEPAESRG